MAICAILGQKIDSRKDGDDCLFNGYLEDYLSLKENEIHIQFKGDAREEAELLKKIVDAGILLHSFYREAGNMENILGKEDKGERSLFSYE